jgi:hypothetical protein
MLSVELCVMVCEQIMRETKGNWDQFQSIFIARCFGKVKGYEAYPMSTIFFYIWKNTWPYGIMYEAYK